MRGDALGGRPDRGVRRRPRRARQRSRWRRRGGWTGWRAFVRGACAELPRAASPLRGARLEIAADVPRGAGLSSSAALEVALVLALLALSGVPEPPRLELAKLCSRIENDWVGAQTGLLDQIASLFGERGRALLGSTSARSRCARSRSSSAGHRLVTLDSGERHAHAGSGYNERRAQCEAALSRALGVAEPARCDARDGGGAAPTARPARAARRHRERARARGGAALERGDVARRSGRCSTRRTRACATTTRSRPPRSRRRSRGCATPGRSARGSSAAASAATCSACAAGCARSRGRARGAARAGRGTVVRPVAARDRARGSARDPRGTRRPSRAQAPPARPGARSPSTAARDVRPDAGRDAAEDRGAERRALVDRDALERQLERRGDDLRATGRCARRRRTRVRARGAPPSAATRSSESRSP